MLTGARCAQAQPQPKPQDVTIRRIGDAAPVEVVSPDELARRKEEADWQRYRQAHGLDLEAEHALLALRLGDVAPSRSTRASFGGSCATSTALSAPSPPARSSSISPVNAASRSTS